MEENHSYLTTKAGPWRPWLREGGLTSGDMSLIEHTTGMVEDILYCAETWDDIGCDYCDLPEERDEHSEPPCWKCRIIDRAQELRKIGAEL